MPRCYFLSVTGASAVDQHSNNVSLWNLETGKVAKKLYGHWGDVQALAYTPDGKFLLSVSDDHTVRVWDAALGREVRSFDGHEDKVESLSISADGQRAVTASRDATALIWDLTNLEVKK